MLEAYRRTRKDGAVGVDGQTAREYAVNLEENLRSLIDRAKSGRYRAPAVRRVHIPKGKGRETRPIGIPTRYGTDLQREPDIRAFEDKVLQRAVVMVLEAVYEQDFLSCSYGFRPGRSAHQALDVLWHELMDVSGGWVLEVDTRKFFDTIDHAKLRDILCQRVRDGVLLRLIGKWLNAGVLESGNVSYPDSGTPQGGVISPLLANIFLHEVVDVWFEHTVRPRLKGRARLIRYADDMLMVFAREDDARRVLAVLPGGVGRRTKSGAPTRPAEAIREVRAHAPSREDPAGAVQPAVAGLRPALLPAPCGARGGDRKGGPRGPRSGTFDLLGFTHYWGRTRSGGWPGALARPTLVRRTMRRGGQAQDGGRPVQPCAFAHCHVVPDTSASQGQRAVAGAVPEADGALRVLRDNRELEGPR